MENERLVKLPWLFGTAAAILTIVGLAVYTTQVSANIDRLCREQHPNEPQGLHECLGPPSVTVLYTVGFGLPFVAGAFALGFALGKSIEGACRN